jgi:hypothetical protein
MIGKASLVPSQLFSDPLKGIIERDVSVTGFAVRLHKNAAQRMNGNVSPKRVSFTGYCYRRVDSVGKVFANDCTHSILDMAPQRVTNI